MTGRPTNWERLGRQRERALGTYNRFYQAVHYKFNLSMSPFKYDAFLYLAFLATGIVAVVEEPWLKLAFLGFALLSVVLRTVLVKSRK